MKEINYIYLKQEKNSVAIKKIFFLVKCSMKKSLAIKVLNGYPQIKFIIKIYAKVGVEPVLCN